MPRQVPKRARQTHETTCWTTEVRKRSLDAVVRLRKEQHRTSLEGLRRLMEHRSSLVVANNSTSSVKVEKWRRDGNEKGVEDVVGDMVEDRENDIDGDLVEEEEE